MTRVGTHGQGPVIVPRVGTHGQGHVIVPVIVQNMSRVLCAGVVGIYCS